MADHNHNQSNDTYVRMCAIGDMDSGQRRDKDRGRIRVDGLGDHRQSYRVVEGGNHRMRSLLVHTRH